VFADSGGAAARQGYAPFIFLDIGYFFGWISRFDPGALKSNFSHYIDCALPL
jgi:hypothetical protein